MDNNNINKENNTDDGGSNYDNIANNNIINDNNNHNNFNMAGTTRNMIHQLYIIELLLNLLDQVSSICCHDIVIFYI